MTKLPSLTGRDLIAALGHAGFQHIRVKGSHSFSPPRRWQDHGRAGAWLRDHWSGLIREDSS